MRTIKRIVAGSAVAIGLMVGGLALPASAAPGTTAMPKSTVVAPSGNCVVLTNSIQRLYKAFFLRDGEDAGTVYWFGQYSSGQRNLVNIADWFSQSPEFVARYGALDNAQFVGLIYQNVLGRQAEPE